MAVNSEVAGVSLSFVTRQVIGDILDTKTRFDPLTGENITEEIKVKDPVIVFFPNGTSQVMSSKHAEGAGYLNQPEIMNISMVGDQRTPAGRYKNAIREEDRCRAWLDLEGVVINKCIGKSGHPLPLDCRVDENSLFFTLKEKEVA
jgi:hypothetical protein